MADLTPEQLCKQFVESLGKPAFTIIGFQDGSKIQVTFAVTKMKKKAALKGMLLAVDKYIENSIKD